MKVFVGKFNRKIRKHLFLMLRLSLTKNKNPKEGAFMIKSIQQFQTNAVKSWKIINIAILKLVN